MKIENEHFHHEDKNCKFKTCQKKIQQKASYIKKDGTKVETQHLFTYYVCTKHNKNVCHCGWEIGWHQGINSKEI